MIVETKNFNHNFGRVHDGKDAKITDFPFIAAVNLYIYGVIYFCGSSIAQDDALITAAHCVVDAEKITIIAGTTHWTSGQRDDTAQVRDSPRYQAHEDFDDFNLTNDIGVIFLDEKLDFTSDAVNSIEVAEEDPLVGEIVTAVGWGATRSFGPVSDILEYADDLVIVDDQIVIDFFPGNDLKMEQFVCILNEVDGICGGDSGGPIINSDGKLFGATSFSARNCEVGPGCFSSVPFHRDWIRGKGIDI